MAAKAKWFFLIPLLVFLGCSERGHPDNRPNILLIVADDRGYADVGVYGSNIRIGLLSTGPLPLHPRLTAQRYFPPPK